MYRNTAITVVTLAIGENGSKIAYFLHSAWCAPFRLPDSCQALPSAEVSC